MAFTSIKSDPCRLEKQLHISTNTGRYQLAVPGPGSNVGFEEDPFLRLQKHGANLRTDTINLESDLRGMSRSLTRDCTNQNNYQQFAVKTSKVNYPSATPFTEQSRATHPAWLYKDLEQVNWGILPLNPQEHTCIPFHNNLSTRILEKDYYTPDYPCINNDSAPSLPHDNFINPQKKNYCSSLNSCGNVGRQF